ncbi:hypothetical protein [Mycolicibacterium helvum]|uniref:Alanine and proline rich membrane protein n=1 Tax=Mycolicibacterium helvum TaxID=1534349 RepID=A0A7I7T0R3_9MYCO|nr:hypothetical protein [Mycolicibacterium helvum]BBY62628.1 hypothetical protein MHEL_08710 [Mycolicibacterium helvum]
MSDADQDVEVRSAPTLTAPTIWQRLVPFAILLAVTALAVSIWVAVRVSTNEANGVALRGDPKTRVCTAFEMVTAIQSRSDLAPANASLALLGGGDYLMRQLDANTPAHLAGAVRAFARDLQEVGMNALAGVPYNDPRQAARQAEGDFERRQVADLCK